MNHVIAFDIEHEGQGAEAFAVGFGVVSYDIYPEGSPGHAAPKLVERHSLVAVNTARRYIAQTQASADKETDQFWVWPENLAVLHGMIKQATCAVLTQGECGNVDCQPLGVAGYVACERCEKLSLDSLACETRAIIDDLYARFPNAVWFSDTAGGDMWAVNHLLVNGGCLPIHFAGPNQYRGYKFDVNTSVPSRKADVATNHDAGWDAVHIATYCALAVQARSSVCLAGPKRARVDGVEVGGEQ
jgi:hypothetical protein